MMDMSCEALCTSLHIRTTRRATISNQLGIDSHVAMIFRQYEYQPYYMNVLIFPTDNHMLNNMQVGFLSLFFF